MTRIVKYFSYFLTICFFQLNIVAKGQNVITNSTIDEGVINYTFQTHATIWDFDITPDKND